VNDARVTQVATVSHSGVPAWCSTAERRVGCRPDSSTRLLVNVST
jgi:hypothetical protein